MILFLFKISELTNILKQGVSEAFVERFWVIDKYSEQTETQSE